MRYVNRLFLCAFIGLTVFDAFGQDLSKVKLKSTQLSERVYFIEPVPGLAGNLAVSVGEDGILLVDDQMMPLTSKIEAAVARIQSGPIDFLVNTHYHYDHAGGNAAFGDVSTLVAHANVRKRLAEGREAGARFIEGERPRQALPVITFKQSLTFHWNGEDVDVIHFPNPSHTDGDSVIYFRRSNVLHTGDQYVNLGGFPYIDRDVGGSATGLRDNIAAILEMIDEETKIIPGHGPLARKGDLKAFHGLVAESIAIVATGREAGMNLAEIQAAGLPDKFSDAKGFMPEAAWIQFVYASLED